MNRLPIASGRETLRQALAALSPGRRWLLAPLAVVLLAAARSQRRHHAEACQRFRNR